jgi:transcriptional regulator with XRE-family HTH domain
MPSAARTPATPDLAARLRALRRTRGISLSKLGRATGLSTAYLSAIETRKIRNPGCNAVLELARYYGVPVAQLLGEREQRVAAPLTFEEALEHLRCHASAQSRAAVIAIAQLTAEAVSSSPPHMNGPRSTV